MSERGGILLLEDDPNLGVMMAESLERAGYAVTLRTDGQAGLDTFAPGRFDLCLVDVMLPRLDGFSFAKEVRRRDPAVPLLFVTARSMTEDRLAGFEIGADDYVTKPFSMEELLLRIRAVLRRCGRQEAAADGGEGEPGPEAFTLGAYRFDVRRQRLLIEDREQPLTDKETQLLRLLCLHTDRTLDRGFALREIWGDDSYHCGRSMDVFISRLRKHLDQDGRITIKAVHGRGYRLMVD